MVTALRDLRTAALHRIDAWGVALIVSLVALLLHDAVAPSTIAVACSIAALYALGYAVNDWFDAPNDARDPAKARVNYFVRHPLGPAAAGPLFVAALCLLGVPLLLSGAAGVALLLLNVAVMWAYSAPPLRLKARPGLDVVAHAAFVQTYAYAMCVAVIRARWTPVDAVLLGVNFFASLSGQLAQQLRDFDVDADTEPTFVTVVGRRSATVCLRLATLALVVVVMLALATRVVPMSLAPLAAAFAPAAFARVRGRRTPLAVASTAGALVYTGALVVAHALS